MGAESGSSRGRTTGQVVGLELEQNSGGQADQIRCSETMQKWRKRKAVFDPAFVE